MLNLKKANNRVEEIDNQITYLLNKKELELSKVLPKAVELKQDKVATSRVEKNKFLHYAYQIDEIDSKLDFLYKEKEILEKFITSELERLNKYNEVEKLIVYYKEQVKEKYTWLKISQLVHYSETHCRNIYRKYKKSRVIE